MGGPQSSRQASLQQHIPPQPSRPPRNLPPPRARFHTSGRIPHLRHDPEAPTRRGAAPLPVRNPAPRGIEKRAPPSPRAPGHGPALPPPTRPNRAAARSGPSTVRRTRRRLLSPRPTEPAPRRLAAAPCPLPCARLPAHRLAAEPRPLPCPASVPSSSRSNRPTPPARAMTSHAPSPLRIDVKARHRPPAPFIETQRAPGAGPSPLDRQLRHPRGGARLPSLRSHVVCRIQ